ncbi:hypothetical protein BaRGS_00034903 [Batillaria attramentaria]|uniref:Uncharacterized protein n=1 Tax=Batillaria attramentaria TaxID=370345 RepID=A0ABD0JHH8_9CAEN
MSHRLPWSFVKSIDPGMSAFNILLHATFMGLKKKKVIQKLVFLKTNTQTFPACHRPTSVALCHAHKFSWDVRATIEPQLRNTLIDNDRAKADWIILSSP